MTSYAIPTWKPTLRTSCAWVHLASIVTSVRVPVNSNGGW